MTISRFLENFIKRASDNVVNQRPSAKRNDERNAVTNAHREGSPSWVNRWDYIHKDWPKDLYKGYGETIWGQEILAGRREPNPVARLGIQ